MGTGKEFDISRRDFARTAALVSAGSAFAPASLLDRAPAHPAAPALPPAAQTPATASGAEIETRIQAILARYGDRFSEGQKVEIRRLAADAQGALDRLRAFPTENGDGPALYLHPLNERPRKSAGIAPPPNQPSISKKP